MSVRCDVHLKLTQKCFKANYKKIINLFKKFHQAFLIAFPSSSGKIKPQLWEERPSEKHITGLVSAIPPHHRAQV